MTVIEDVGYVVNWLNITGQSGFAQRVNELIERHEKLINFVESLGEVHGENYLTFNNHVCNVVDKTNDIRLSLSSSLPMHEPMVTCQETGNVFVMNWEGIARLAIRFGVDLEKKT